MYGACVTRAVPCSIKLCGSFHMISEPGQEVILLSPIILAPIPVPVLVLVSLSVNTALLAVPQSKTEVLFIRNRYY